MLSLVQSPRTCHEAAHPPCFGATAPAAEGGARRSEPTGDEPPTSCGVAAEPTRPSLYVAYLSLVGRESITDADLLTPGIGPAAGDSAGAMEEQGGDADDGQ